MRVNLDHAFDREIDKDLSDDAERSLCDQPGPT